MASLSYESWSELHEEAEVSKTARSALSQIRRGGIIVSSSDPIHDDDNDPPCYGAKLIYEEIARGANGSFYCTGEYPSIAAVAPLEFSVTANGLSIVTRKMPANSLLRPVTIAGGLAFPSKAVIPNKPAGFA